MSTAGLEMEENGELRPQGEDMSKVLRGIGEASEFFSDSRWKGAKKLVERGNKCQAKRLKLYKDAEVEVAQVLLNCPSKT